MELRLIIKPGPVARREVLPPDRRPPPRAPADASDDALAAVALIDRTLETIGTEYVVSDGTLLGMVRDGGFIPGDDDIDLKIPRDAVTEAFIAAMERAGFLTIRRAYVEGTLANVGFSYKGIYLDFGGMTVTDGIGQYYVMTEPASGYLTYEFPYTGRERFHFLGVELWRPLNPEKFLEATYGAGWRSPVAGWNHFYDPPGLVAVTGPAQIVQRGALRWAGRRGATPPRPHPRRRRRRWRSLFRWF